MKVRFRIPYRTEWGERLCITGSHKALGSWDLAKACPMAYCAGDEWKIELELGGRRAEFEYQYLVKNERGKILREAGKVRKYSSEESGRSKITEIHDWWHAAQDPTAIFETSAFTEVIFKTPKEKSARKVNAVSRKKGIAVKLRVCVPRLTEGDSVWVTGECAELGCWESKRAIPMERAGKTLWKKEIKLSGASIKTHYKYIIRRADGSADLYEEGDDRLLASESSSVLRNDYAFRYSKPWRGAGLAVPVFSLRSNNGLGVGEFEDLKLLIDWVKSCGLQIIQLLPINDTSALGTWMDSYPYAPISVFALHPIYLNIESCGTLRSRSASELTIKRNALNELASLDYEEVMRFKLRLAREIFEDSKTAFLTSSEFKKFYKENRSWLPAYSLFCVLRDEFQTSDFHEWGKYARVTPATVEKLLAPSGAFYGKAAFYWFLQFHLYRQLEEVCEHAKQQGIVLKGDIPIGLSKRSDSCWLESKLFHLDRSAGAPPDPFSSDGQNWEFPTYDWDAMSQDGYSWWRRRLGEMSRHFQAVRLDHVLGFFRIWEISNDSISGLMGCFNPALPLRQEELEREGIDELDRLVEPFITKEILEKTFGPDAELVKKKYLKRGRGGLFSLKPGFKTQREIEDHFAKSPSLSGEDLKREEKNKKGLQALVTNVILLKDPAGRAGAYHFRINMNKTSSYLALSKSEQEILARLYVDYFYKRQETFWDEIGRRKLPALKSASDMLICGEDLGMVPDCVPVAMEELGLLGLRIQRMPKETDREFGRPEDYPYLSVCTTSSHDMPPLRAWWQEDRARTHRYYKDALNRDGESPWSLEPWIAQNIILRHLESPSMWAVFPLQDLLAMSQNLKRPGDPKEEQINDPSNPHHYWRYRLHITLEDLLERGDFSDRLAGMITCSGRLSAY